MDIISRKIICFCCVSIVSLGLSGCGGGGGGGGGGSSGSTPPTQALTYSGNTNPATITADNTRTLSQNAIGSSDVAVGTVIGILIDQQPTKNSGIVSLAPRLTSHLHNTLDQIANSASSSAQTVAGVSIDTTVPCTTSGSVSLSGSINDTTGTGTLNITFNSCTENGAWLNGQTTYRVDVYNPSYDLDTDATFDFAILQFKDAISDVSLSGAIRSEVIITTGKEKLTSNFVVKDNLSGKFAKAENLVVVVDYGNTYNLAYLPNSSPVNLSITSGRIFDATEGYVDIATTAPWFYASIMQDYPSSGGALVLTGSNNGHIAITPLSTTLVKVELDLDANGTYELFSTMPWTVLETDKTSDSAPTANAGTNHTAPRNTAVTLDGSGSSDPDYDFLTYQWSLVQKPSGSQTQLNAVSSVRPTFTPDLEGNYVISLSVNDGKLSSGTSSITITVINTSPVADAGSNLYTTVGAQTSLDGSGSTDLNGDSLTYHWQLTLSPPGSNTQITNQNNIQPSFTPDLPGLYEAQLTVNDGKLASAADPVRIIAEKSSTGLCSLFGTNSVPASGSASVNLSDDFIPLCHGWVLLRETNTNAIKRINVVTGSVGASYSLSSAATSWELDADNAFLYVAHSNESKITKINLITNVQTTIQLSSPAVSLAVANNGRLFAIQQYDYIQYKSPIALINGLTEVTEKVYDQPPAGVVIAVYDRWHEQLIMGNYYSLASRYRYVFNTSTLSLTLAQTLPNAGSSTLGGGLIISPDGNHVAFPGDFVIGGYIISDASTTDISLSLGGWPIVSFLPKSMAFEPFGESLAVIEDFPALSGPNPVTTIKIFSVATHTLTKTYSHSLSSCSYYSPKKVRLSRDGQVIFSYNDCGGLSNSGSIYWSSFTP